MNSLLRKTSVLSREYLLSQLQPLKSSAPEPVNHKTIPSDLSLSQRYCKTENSGLNLTDQVSTAVNEDALRKSGRNAYSGTPYSSAKKTVGEKTTRSFVQQAASASWITALIIIVLMAVSNSASRTVELPHLIVGGFFVLLLLAGFVFGVVGCLGMKSHGARTTLVPGVIGAGLNATILIILIGIAGVSYLKSSGTAPTNRSMALQRYADQINSKLPRLEGDQIRLDKVTVVNAAQVEYRYTFVNKVKDEIDVNRLVAKVRPTLLENYRTGGDDFKMFRDNKIGLRSTFTDKQGQLIASIVVPEEEAPDKGVQATK